MVNCFMRSLQEDQIYCECANELMYCFGGSRKGKRKEEIIDVSKLQHVICTIHTIMA